MYFNYIKFILLFFSRSAKVFVRQMSTDVNWDEFDAMIAEFGEVLNLDRGK